MPNCKQPFLKMTLLFISFSLLSCKTVAQEPAKNTDNQNTTVISKDLKWSDRMALTLMKNHPEAYMIDDVKSPKWDYVHGLVLHSFEELYKKNPDTLMLICAREEDHNIGPLGASIHSEIGTRYRQSLQR